MAYESGGIAGKLGGEYEALRAAQMLLRVALGRSTSFRAEPPGGAGDGIEFEVAEADGTVRREQCKARNGMRPDWSISELRSRGVLGHAAAQLADEKARFRFASGVPAVELRTLAERAGRCKTADEFFDFKVSNDGLRAALPALAAAWNLDPVRAAERERLWRMLRRVEVVHVDEPSLREWAHEQAAPYFRGDAAACVAFLKDLFVCTLGRTLGQHDVLRAMREAGHAPRLDSPEVVADRVLLLADRYAASLRPLMIGGTTLGRDEAGAIRAMLADAEGPRVVLVHGGGGVGKSGVMLEVADGLAADGVPHLPVRLDRDAVPDSAQHWGESLGLPLPPHATLDRAAAGGPAVLLVDQLDALRWTTRHSPHAWHTCRDVLDGIVRGDAGGVRAVVACRSVDLAADPELAAWFKGYRDDSRVGEIKVELLGPPAVLRILEANGRPKPATPVLAELLRSPFLLSLLLRMDPGDAAGLTTQTQLIDRYWQEQVKALAGVDGGSGCVDLIEALAADMDRRASLSVSRREHALRFGPQIDAMASRGALVEDGDRLAFAHQIHADYHVARGVMRRVTSGGGGVAEWLDEGRQSLFRRRPLRQLLDLLRDDDPRAYLRMLRELFDDGRDPPARFHLRHLALVVLGQWAAPMAAEVEFALDLASRPDLGRHVEARVFAEPAWLRRLHERGELVPRVRADDAGRLRWGLLRLMRNDQPLLDAVLAEVGGELEGRLQREILQFHAVEDLGESMFDRWLGDPALNLPNADIRWEKLVECNPLRAIRLLANWSDSACRAEGVDDEPRPRKINFRAIAAAAGREPGATLELLLPRRRRLSQCARGRRGRWTFESHRRLQRLQVVRRAVRSALLAAVRSLAAENPQRLWSVLDYGSPYHPAGLRPLVAQALLADLATAPDAAVGWLLRDPRHLAALDAVGGRPFAGRYQWSRRLISRFAGDCSPPMFDELVRAAGRHAPRWEKSGYAFYVRGGGRAAWHCWAAGYHLRVGEYLLLSAMPRDRLPPRAIDRLGTLRRRFGPARNMVLRRQRRDGLMSSVRPRVAANAGRLSPAAWGRLARDASRWEQAGHDRGSHRNYPQPEFVSRILETTLEGRPDLIGPVLERLRVGAHPAFVAAALSAAAKRARRKNVAPEEVAALASGVEAFYFELEPSRRWEAGVAKEFCEAIQAAPTQSWAARTVAALEQLVVAHPDPADGEFPPFGDSDLDHKGDLDTCAINCVRGVAVGAVAALLLRRPDSPHLRRALAAAAADPHPAVRTAAHRLPLVLLRGDPSNPQAAVELACRINEHAEDHVLAAHAFADLLSYTLLDPELRGRLRPTLARMVGSHRQGAAEAGASWATLVFLHRGELENLVEAALAGTPQQRLAIATAVDRHLDGPDPAAAATLLCRLFDDPDPEVRDATASIVADSALHPARRALLEAFVTSPAFASAGGRVLRALDEHAGPLLPLADALLGAAGRTGVAIPEGHPWFSAAFLVRLHGEADEAGDDRVASASLDAIDALLRDGRAGDIFGPADAV